MDKAEAASLISVSVPIICLFCMSVMITTDKPIENQPELLENIQMSKLNVKPLILFSLEELCFTI